MALIYLAMMLSSAIRSGCDEIITEDFQAGQVVQGIKYINPFVSR
jgi:predicted nucleic acid-binding protein